MNYPVARRLLPFQHHQRVVHSWKATHETRGPETRPLKCVTYNCLAQALMNRRRFPFVSRRHARWKYRNQRLLQEISDSGADVLALQEIDAPQEDPQFWSNALAQMGYDCWLERGPRSTRFAAEVSLNEKAPYGIMLCWKKDMFECVDRELVEFSKELVQQQQQQQRSGDQIGEDDACLMDESQFRMQANLGQIVALRYRDDDRYGIVCTNAHLYWRPNHPYTRLRQVCLLLQKAISFDRRVSSKLGFTHDLPLLMLGDTNDNPHCLSYRFLTDETARQMHHLREQFEYDQVTQWPILELRDAESEVKLQYADLLTELHHVDGLSPDEPPTPFESRVLEIESQKRTRRYEDFAEEMRTCLPTLLSAYGHYDRLDPDFSKDLDFSKFCNNTDAKPEWSGEPQYTNYIGDYKFTLDYIFAVDQNEAEQKQRCVLNNQHGEGILIKEILQIPPLHRMEETKDGIPGEIFSSDHVLLMCTFELRPCSTQPQNCIH